MLSKSILCLSFMIPFFSMASEIVHTFDCKMLYRSNMKRLTLTLVEQKVKGKKNLQATIYFTKADKIIRNRVLTGNTNLGRERLIYLNMDKDPYDGQVGTFYWSFSFPRTFLEGKVPAEFGTDISQLMAYKWDGTPHGQGTNTGYGYLDHWSCRSLND